MLKKLPAIIPLILLLAAANLSARAQETEVAANSNLTGVALPANARRVLSASVPAQVAQTLEKLVAASDGQLRQGDSEVLVWSGANFRKANAPAIITRLSGNLKNAGWQYDESGSQDGVTIFSAFKNGAQRRGVIGFYGATDDALIFAWTEVMSASSGNGQGGQTVKSSDGNNGEGESAPSNGRNNGSSVVGVWTNGSVSTVGERNTVTGMYTPSNGSTFKYVFTADGRFEFYGLINSTMYGCTTSLFNDKRGRYEISGSQITLIPNKNYWKNTYSCSPSSNKERDYVLERETYRFNTKRNEYGQTLVCLTDAKGERCFRREEK
jgi:hypothetical protein